MQSSVVDEFFTGVSYGAEVKTELPDDGELILFFKPNRRTRTISSEARSSISDAVSNIHCIVG